MSPFSEKSICTSKYYLVVSNIYYKKCVAYFVWPDVDIFFIDRAFFTSELSLCMPKYILHAKTESNIYLNISACILCDPEWILFYLWWTREDHQDGWLGQATTINSTSSANRTHDFELMCKNKFYALWLCSYNFNGNFIDWEVREEFIHTVALGYWETCDVGNIWKVFGKYLLL